MSAPRSRLHAKSARTDPAPAGGGGSFWLGVSAALNVVTLMLALAAAVIYTRIKDAGAQQPCTSACAAALLLAAALTSFRFYTQGKPA